MAKVTNFEELKKKYSKLSRMKYIGFVISLFAILLPNFILTCKSVEELDNCAYEVSFLKNKNRQVPKNDAEVVAMCGRVKGGLKCIKDDVTACMNGTLQAVGTMILTDLENHFNTRCDSAPHRADFLQHVQCFADQAKADAVRVCADKHQIMLERVVNLPKEAQLGGSCCSNHAMRECIIGQTKKLCSGQTGDYFDDIIQEATTDHIANVCKEFADLNVCNSKYDGAIWGELKAIMASTDAASAKKHQYKTTLPILVKMMTS